MISLKKTQKPKGDTDDETQVAKDAAAFEEIDGEKIVEPYITTVNKNGIIINNCHEETIEVRSYSLDDTWKFWSKTTEKIGIF